MGEVIVITFSYEKEVLAKKQLSPTAGSTFKMTMASLFILHLN